jgi:hypothetical protein
MRGNWKLKKNAGKFILKISIPHSSQNNSNNLFPSSFFFIYGGGE